MQFALYDARIYMDNMLVFHTYYHTNQLPIQVLGLSNDQICKLIMVHIDKYFVRGEQLMNIADCLVTVFGCDRKDPIPLEQRHLKPYIIKINP